MTVKGVKLSKLQRKIYDACNLDTEDSIIVVSCGRQVGKSTVASQIICNWCFNNYEYKVGFYAPTYKQAREQYKRMEKGLRKVRDIEFNKSELLITFPNGSSCLFITADNDGMRGYSFDSIVIDEAGFVKDEIFNAGILPTVAVSVSRGNGKILLISTPKRKNYFYEYFSKDIEGKLSITATSEEGGFISKNLLKQIRANTPEHIYKNEYLAEFLEDGTGVFRYLACINDNIRAESELIYAAVDWGIEDDYTVLTIQDSVGNVLLQERWTGIDWIKLIDKIVDRLNIYNVNTIWSEVNGIGNMPTKELRKKFPNTKDWNTSNKSKVDIINKLAADFQTESIKIPREDSLFRELDAFELKYTPKTKKVTYSARSGFHDDNVMSLAIVNFNRSKNPAKTEVMKKKTVTKPQDRRIGMRNRRRY